MMSKAFEDVMASFYKQSAKRIAHNAMKKDRFNKVYGQIKGIKHQCVDLKAAHDHGGFIIDLRTPEEYSAGGVVYNALNVPVEHFWKWFNSSTHNENTQILLYSKNGIDSQTVYEKLSKPPYNYTNVKNIGDSVWYSGCSH